MEHLSHRVTHLSPTRGYRRQGLSLMFSLLSRACRWTLTTHAISGIIYAVTSLQDTMFLGRSSWVLWAGIWSSVTQEKAEPLLLGALKRWTGRTCLESTIWCFSLSLMGCKVQRRFRVRSIVLGESLYQAHQLMPRHAYRPRVRSRDPPGLAQRLQHSKQVLAMRRLHHMYTALLHHRILLL